MTDDFDTIKTLEELWEWCQKHRKSAWAFPDKWGVLGYLGTLELGIVADVPAPRSQEHLKTGKPYANHIDVFTTNFDKRLYNLLNKYGLENAHLMDAHISIVEDKNQDRLVFLKQIEIVKPEALLIMGGPRSKVWKTVEGYLKGWNGTLPRMYQIWHYTYRFPTDAEWEKVFRSALVEVAANHPNLASIIRIV